MYTLCEQPLWAAANSASIRKRQCLYHFTVFYEYPDERRVYFTCRQQAGCSTLVDELVIGTRGRAWLLKSQIEGENTCADYQRPARQYV